MSHRMLLLKTPRKSGIFPHQGATFKPWQPRFLTVLAFVLNRKVKNAKTSKNTKRIKTTSPLGRLPPMFLRCWMKAICGFMMCSTAPRWSTSSPTSLLFVVSGAVRFATSEPQNSGTRGMSRPPCLQTLTLANWPHTIPESRGLSRVSRTADPTSAPLPGCSGSR